MATCRDTSACAQVSSVVDAAVEECARGGTVLLAPTPKRCTYYREYLSAVALETPAVHVCVLDGASSPHMPGGSLVNAFVRAVHWDVVQCTWRIRGRREAPRACVRLAVHVQWATRAVHIAGLRQWRDGRGSTRVSPWCVGARGGVRRCLRTVALTLRNSSGSGGGDSIAEQ